MARQNPAGVGAAPERRDQQGIAETRCACWLQGAEPCSTPEEYRTYIGKELQRWRRGEVDGHQAD
jgi:hypothetical protein